MGSARTGGVAVMGLCCVCHRRCTAGALWWAQRSPPWGTDDLRATSDEVRERIRGGLVTHDGHPLLAEQVVAARRVVPRDGVGAGLLPPAAQTIHLARALVWCVAEATRQAPAVPAPVLRLA